MDGYNYASITTILTAPLSRGNLTLESADPHVHPLIDPCWLCDPGDVEVALAAFKVRGRYGTFHLSPTYRSDLYTGPDWSTEPTSGFLRPYTRVSELSTTLQVHVRVRMPMSYSNDA